MERDIQFSNGETRLSGTLHLPEGHGPHPALVVAHSASEGMRSDPFYRHLAEDLPPLGWAVLLYDRRGSGASTGSFETASFQDLAGDLAAGWDALRGLAELDGGMIGLYGVSQGGWIAPLAAVLRPQAAFVVVVSGSGVSPAEQMDYSARTALKAGGYSDEIARQAIQVRQRVNEYYRGRETLENARAAVDEVAGEAWFELAWIGPSSQISPDVTGDKWFYEMDYDPLAVWQQVRQPALFLFGDNDRWVPVDESMEAFGRASASNRNVTIRQISGADHLMAGPGMGAGQVSAGYVDALLEWLDRQRRAVNRG